MKIYYLEKNIADEWKGINLNQLSNKRGFWGIYSLFS